VAGRALARLLGRAKRRAIRYSEHLTGDGPTVFEHVCRIRLEGIVSEPRMRPIAALKSKNPESAALRRENEEEWRSPCTPAFMVLPKWKTRRRRVQPS
jgi:hypothetical protein